MQQFENRIAPDSPFGAAGEFEATRHGRGGNAAMPKVCTDAQSFSARAARVSCSPRSVMFGVVRTPNRILDDVVPQSERTLERPHVLHQQAARLVGLEEPLVRVRD